MAYEEQDYNKRAFEWPVWKSILPYLKPYQKTLLVILTLNLACAAIDILMPLFQRYAIDHFIEARTSSDRKSTRLNSSHASTSRMPSSA